MLRALLVHASERYEWTRCGSFQQALCMCTESTLALARLGISRALTGRGVACRARPSRRSWADPPVADMRQRRDLQCIRECLLDTIGFLEAIAVRCNLAGSQ